MMYENSMYGNNLIFKKKCFFKLLFLSNACNICILNINLINSAANLFSNKLVFLSPRRGIDFCWPK